MNDLFCDIGYYSLNKDGETLCGDRVQCVSPNEDDEVIVLADGLGSGVKANILSTLTSKIISTMVAGGMSIEDCVATIAATLPVCKVRNVAYSTFTILRILGNDEAEIIQYDNPHVIVLRDGKYLPLPESSVTIENKVIYKSRLTLREGDALIAMSDGCIHAGVGLELNFGWQRENIIEYMEKMYNPDFTAKTLATLLLDECERLYGGKPGDDTTVCAVKIRPRQSVNLMLGPPADPADVNKMMSLFFAKSGKHIVCGGTTSTLAGQFLGKEVKANLDYLDPEIPPIGFIEGVDLCTEGVLTMKHVVELARRYSSGTDTYSEWIGKKDGASLIAQMLFESATDVNLFVGRAMNPAHQNPDMPIDLSIKLRLIEDLAKYLELMGKTVKVSYY